MYIVFFTALVKARSAVGTWVYGRDRISGSLALVFISFPRPEANPRPYVANREQTR